MIIYELLYDESEIYCNTDIISLPTVSIGLFKTKKKCETYIIERCLKRHGIRLSAKLLASFKDNKYHINGTLFTYTINKRITND